MVKVRRAVLPKFLGQNMLPNLSEGDAGCGKARDGRGTSYKPLGLGTANTQATPKSQRTNWSIGFGGGLHRSPHTQPSNTSALHNLAGSKLSLYQLQINFYFNDDGSLRTFLPLLIFINLQVMSYSNLGTKKKSLKFCSPILRQMIVV